MAKEAKEDPSKFASGQAGDFFLDILIMPAVLVLGSLTVLFILGFTSFPSFLGGPNLFFRILFFLALTAIFFASYFLYKIYKVIKSVTKKVVDKTIKVESKVVE